MDTNFEAELRTLLAERRKIEAIKLYREHTGAGLKEAKEAVEALEREGTLPQIEPRASATLEEEIVFLIDVGRKIDAIKLYRERAGVGLKEAKEAVEALAAQQGMG